MAAGSDALSEATTTGLIFTVGAGGSFALVLAMTLYTFHRARRRAPRFVRRRNRVGRPAGFDGFPQQPYSTAERSSHQPYSRPYRIPRQDGSQNPTNGARPSGSTGVPTTPWPPED